jgi:hypothetical protein
MTLKTNARIAGSTLLLYIVAGVAQMVVGAQAGRGSDVAARLANMAQHADLVRISVLLGFLTSFIALTLGVSLYAITRAQDADLAMLGLVCRVAEGVLGAVFLTMSLALLAIAKTPGESAGVASFIFSARRLSPLFSATFFAVGSALFSWLMLRGRMIPTALAWLGVIASVILVIALPLQLAGLVSGTLAQVMWIPMAAFEIPVGLWLIVKGVSVGVRGES